VEKIPNMLAYYGVNAVSASDNCGGYVDLKLETKLLDEGNCKADGYIAKYLYIWTAIDPCGNESTFELTGKFIDNTAPVFENIPQDITLYCNDVMPEFKTINATDCYLDNMTKQQILVQTVDNSTAYNRIWTATDLCGNTSTAIQIITIKGSGHSCNINLPEGPISCASIDNIITSTITGGQGPFTYEWELVNCDGYISGGQGTDNIKVVNGYTVVNISLKVTDAKGCVSYCTASFDCVEGNDVVGDLINGHEIIQSVTANKTTLNATISIFPNPAIDVFQVTAESYTGEYVVVQVIDILGKIIKSEVLKEMPYKGIEINLHDQAEGIYLVNILKSGHEPLMKKVMIIHK
ncbi:MAG: T9SS type A sorting domain-containing protein, partial [Saprospiraceae bacterium]|nr:T9SS type A sorting domain-containing protein [Saprospiraceae bacterium]